MKVLYDYQGFVQKTGGVSRYHSELIKNLPIEIQPKIPFILSDNLYLNELNTKHLSICPNSNSKNKENIYKAIDMISCTMALKIGKFDIFHPTFLNPYYIEKTSKPTVITIHDLTHEKFPHAVVKADIVKKKRLKCIENANAVICISEETKTDLQKFYNVPDSKITVIYHGANQNLFVSNSKSMYDKPYVLFIGKRSQYKNFDRFIEAFSLQRNDIDLVCTGNDFTKTELQKIHKLKLDNRVHHIFATNSQMDELLFHARAFVYPSLGEGFGLPILEAFRCSCPCIISNLRCFKEVAGNSAIYFNPENIDDIAATLSNAIDNNEQLNKLRSLARERLRMFTWEKTALKTSSVYKSLL